MHSNSMFDRLKGQSALVTGAGSGIGAALARGLGRIGVTVVCTARTQADLDAVVADIKGEGGQAFAFAADATDAEQMNALAARIDAQLGSLDLAYLNAGGNWQKQTILESDCAEWQAAFEQNLMPVFHGIRAVVPLMRKAGGGRIIFTGSAMAHYAAATNSSYCAGKAAARMLANTAALELADDHITVNEFIPGPVRSKQALAHYDKSDKNSPFNNPREWVKEPEDVVETLLFMAAFPGAGPTSQIFSLARR